MLSPSPSLAMLAVLILAAPASAATVDVYEGDMNVRLMDGVYVPVDGIDVHEGKMPCASAGWAWKDLSTDEVRRECAERERRHYAVVQWDEPRGFVPQPVVSDLPPRFNPPVWHPLGCCGHGGHVPPPERPPEPPAPAPLPGAIWALMAALSGLTLITRRRKT